MVDDPELCARVIRTTAERAEAELALP